MDNKSHYSVGVYKYGQGYWVRMMTAIFAGILVLSAAAWLWGQVTRVDIPTPRWSFTVEAPQGVPPAGATVTMRRAGDPGEKIGTGVVESFATSGRAANLIVGQLALEPNARPIESRQIEATTPDGARTFYATVARADGLRAFNLLYLQAGVAAAVILLGGLLIYYYVGRNPSTVDFLIATDGEMRKVNWGTKKVILDSTYVVIGATFLIATVIFVSDTLLSSFFRAIGVLGTR